LKGINKDKIVVGKQSLLLEYNCIFCNPVKDVYEIPICIYEDDGFTVEDCKK